MLFQTIDSFLSGFRSCFSREAAFDWFRIIVVGLIVRFDHYGTTSFIRWLFIDPQYYGLILHFFRTSSWTVGELMDSWTKAVVNRFPIIEINGRSLIIGDTIKVGKEARKMPAVTTLRQESEDNAKPELIRGHHFAFIGMLVGSVARAFCVPLQAQLTEGVESLRAQSETIVSRMADLAVLKATQMGRLCYLSLDAYFSVGPAFLILKRAVNEKGEQLVHLITRAKDNYVGFCDQSPKGYKDKDKIPLIRIFDYPHLFEQAQVMIKGELKTISYLCIDLLWKPVDSLIRFVCVMDGDGRYILMSSDLNLPALDIIAIYNYRAKIEVMFLMLKHLIGGFCYHFWTKSFPSLKRGQRLDISSLSEEAKQKFIQTLDAVERFVNLSSLAMGLLEYLSLTRSSLIWKLYEGWLRTSTSDHPSEGVVQSVIRSEFFTAIGKATAGKVPSSRTLQLIIGKGRPPRMQEQLEEAI